MQVFALKGIDRAQQRAHEPPPADAAEQQYRWLIEHSPVAICVHAAGRYVYVNQTLVRKIGAHSADQLLGRKITDFIHPDSLAAVRRQITARQHDGDVSPPLELVIVTLDGLTREVEALAIRTQWEGRPAHKVVFRAAASTVSTGSAMVSGYGCRSTGRCLTPAIRTGRRIDVDCRHHRSAQCPSAARLPGHARCVDWAAQPRPLGDVNQRCDRAR